MAEERKDSFAETVDTAASAAHTVKGAIKAGKAISGAAKGAAAGGPYGAVAGAVWAGRKHIGKIIAVIPPFTVPVKSRKWGSTPRRCEVPGLRGCFWRPPAFLSPTTAAQP